jgi:integrase
MARIFPSAEGLVNKFGRYPVATPKQGLGSDGIPLGPSKQKPARPLKRRPATEISVATLNKARCDVDAKLPSGPYEVPDKLCRGLVLRVRPRSITWIFRARFANKFKTWTVSSITNLTAPSKARDRVGEARVRIRRGIDPAEWFREQELGGPVERTFDVVTDGWDYEAGVTKYLSHVKSEKRDATHKDYKSCLKPQEFIERVRKPAKLRSESHREQVKDAVRILSPSPLYGDLRPLRGKLLKAITDDDIANVRSAIYNRGKRAQSNHVLRVLKAFFRWAAAEPSSGLKKLNPARDVPFLYKQKKDPDRVKRLKARTPTIDELSRLPNLLSDKRVHPSIRIATRLAEYSAQRRLTVRSAEQEEFTNYLPDFDLPSGWGVWVIPSSKMKTDRPHNIPLPPSVWSLVQEAKTLAGKSKWLFPQLRERRHGSGMTGHVSEKVINNALKRIGLQFGPHDLRRAFAKYGRMRKNGGAGLSLNQVRLITHPSEVDPENESLMGSYAIDEFLDEKIEIMTKWCEWLDRLARKSP